MSEWKQYAVSVILREKDAASSEIINSLRFCTAPCEEAALGAVMKALRQEFSGAVFLAEMACEVPPLSPPPPAGEVR